MRDVNDLNGWMSRSILVFTKRTDQKASYRLMIGSSWIRLLFSRMMAIDGKTTMAAAAATKTTTGILVFHRRAKRNVCLLARSQADKREREREKKKTPDIFVAPLLFAPLLSFLPLSFALASSTRRWLMSSSDDRQKIYRCLCVIEFLFSRSIFLLCRSLFLVQNRLHLLGEEISIGAIWTLSAPSACRSERQKHRYTSSEWDEKKKSFQLHHHQPIVLPVLESASAFQSVDTYNFGSDTTATQFFPTRRFDSSLDTEGEKKIIDPWSGLIRLTKVTWLEELAPGDSLSLVVLGGFMIDLEGTSESNPSKFAAGSQTVKRWEKHTTDYSCCRTPPHKQLAGLLTRRRQWRE